MKKYYHIFIIMFVMISVLNLKTSAQNMRRIITDTEKQTDFMIEQIKKSKASWSNDSINKNKPELVSPRSLSAEGNLILVPAKDWTSGFFPGVLWFLYEVTGNKKWEDQARIFTSNIENEKLNGKTHDMGFKVYCSYGTGYRLTNDPHYKDVIIQAAITLSTRYNPVVGCIRSWDHNADKWGYPVIIDNMMNLELLFAATKLTGDSSFYKIAVSHANTTMKYHFRSDFSSYHVIDYDTITGHILHRNTHQGYSDESAWARGQAWALYGFTMCFRETRDPKYLQQAENIAGFIMSHPNMPKDLVPYWDFYAPNIPDEPRDASAAAIIASALYELCPFSKKGSYYHKKANQIIGNLTNNYRSPIGENEGFILVHSTGSKPKHIEVDVPLVYADYYYLEALIRSKR